MEEASFEAKLRSVLQEVAFELSATDGEQFLRQCVEHLVQTFEVRAAVPVFWSLGVGADEAREVDLRE